VLEAAVRATNGEVLLAKIDIDKNQGLAQALRIQSVPTIYAFFGGRPIDAFQGALPESQVKAFVAKIVQAVRQSQPDAIDVPQALKDAAQALSEKNLGAAQALYAQILAQDENNAHAYAGIIRVLIAADQVDQAKQLVDNVPPQIAKSNAFQEAKTALELASQKPGGDHSALLAKVNANPDDHQTRFDLAMAQFTSGEQEAGMDSLLEIIQRNRTWNEEEARKQLIKFFEALGHADPLVLAARKKLSSILFS
jgi:putative thioredoxin